jgi:DHA3 family macrolide efflux protein-like MFS transporter
MLFWLKHVTDSPSLMGAVAMVSGLGAALLGPIGGAFADRYSRRSIMIACDLISAFAVFSLSLLMWLTPNIHSLSLGGVVAVSIIVAATNSFFNPAISASTADLVPKERVAGANSMLQASLRLATLLGLGIGGVLFRVLGAPLALLIDGVTYLISAFSKCFITIPQIVTPKCNASTTRARELVRDIHEGLRYVRANIGLTQVLFAATLFNLFMAPILGLFPFYVEDYLKLRPDWYGYLLATYGLGTLVGYLLAGALRVSGKARAVLLLSFMVFASVLYGLLGLFKTPSVIAGIVLSIGIVSSFINVSIITVLQITTPSELRGRVFGLLSTITACLLPIGMGMAGTAAALVGKNISLIYVLCGCCMAIVTLFASTRIGVRNYLSIGQDQASQAVLLNSQVKETAAAR